MCELAQDNAEQILTRYDALHICSPYTLNQDEIGHRRLQNALLRLVAKLKCGEDLVLQHYNSANNMTDRMAALGLVCQSDFECRTEVLERFYADWQDDALVVDKWFAVQANNGRPDVIEQIKRLTKHSSFSYQNPNRLRSLVSTFAMLNQVGFHSSGGEGYRFLSEIIVTVDAINPQTAARLVAPLGRWSRMPEEAKGQMKAALNWVLSHGTLSDDVRELCTKSLC